MNTPPISILSVEDNPADALLLQEALKRDELNGFNLTHAVRLKEGLAYLERTEFDLILIDLDLPDSQGLATFEEMHRYAPETPIVIFSGNPDEQIALRAMSAGAQDYLVKNMNGYDLAGRAIRYAMERSRLSRSLRSSEQSFSRLFHSNPLPQIITTFQGGLIVDANQAFCNKFGYERSDLIGHNTQELDLCADQENWDTVVQLLQADGRVQNYEIAFRSRSGQIFILLSSIEFIEMSGQKCIVSSGLDITENKLVEHELRQANDRFMEITEHISDLIWVADPVTGQNIYISPAFESVFGISPASAVQLPNGTLDLVLPEDREILRSAHEQETAGYNTDVHYRILRADGQVRWIRDRSFPVYDKSGHVVRVVGIARDMTDQVETENRIRESEGRFRQLAENLQTAQQELLELNRTLEERVAQRTSEVQDLYEHAPCGYHSLDGNGRYTRINQTELDWLGYSAGEMLGHSFAEFVSLKYAASFSENLKHLKQQGWAKDLEYELIRKDGSSFPILLSASAIYDAAGEFVATRSTVFDNSERKKAELALRQSEEQNRLLFEEGPDALALVDPSGRFIRVNRAYEQLTRLPAATLLGKTALELELLTLETLKSLQTATHISFARQEDFTTVEYSLVSSDGSIHNVEARIFPLTIGGTDSILISNRDISLRKRAEEALRCANQELERAAHMKNEFLASMSHELRTPLTGILGLTEVLHKGIYGPLNDRQLNAIRIVEESGRHLLNLINDLLDLSKIEAGKLEIDASIVDVGEICQASLRIVKELAASKHQMIAFSCQPAEFSLRADPRRLKQILVNLLSNAVKFTAEGGKLGLEVRADAQQATVYFIVWDNGIGIAPEDISRLFQPFVQLDGGLARSHSGTGLGLSLVRRLVELHGGNVAIESIPNSGSRFIVSLPWQPREPETQPASAIPAPAITAAGPPQSILLVEDNEINILLVSDYLQALGYRVAVARNGQEALQMVADVCPQLILMDIQLPEVSGLEVIRRIRQMPVPQIACAPIIALTALAMPDDREHCLAAGANDYISKPVNLDELVLSIQKHIEHTQ